MYKNSSGNSGVEDAGGRTVTRENLLRVVYDVCRGSTRARARELFEMTLEEIAAALVRGETVKIRSFGLFSVRAKRERIGRNPRTGVETPIKARRVVIFRPSKALVVAINGESANDVEFREE